jgi:hypothetical protein
MLNWLQLRLDLNELITGIEPSIWGLCLVHVRVEIRTCCPFHYVVMYRRGWLCFGDRTEISTDGDYAYLMSDLALSRSYNDEYLDLEENMGLYDQKGTPCKPETQTTLQL